MFILVREKETKYIISLENYRKKKEQEFVDFFNKSEAINKRFHQIELLPGLGKKHMQEIIKQRQESPFKSFEDLKKRVPNLPDPKRTIEKRMFKELTQPERHNLFIKEN